MFGHRPKRQKKGALLNLGWEKLMKIAERIKLNVNDERLNNIYAALCS